MVVNIFLLLVLCLVSVHGHGYLAKPAGRSSIWRTGASGAVINYNDNQLFCGGTNVSLPLK
jgi:hypothetical protein